MKERRNIARLLNPRALLWALLARPAIWLLSRWALGVWTYGYVVSRSGAVAALLLLLTVALAPLRLLFRRGRWLSWLMDRRTDLGMASVAFAGLHTAAYSIGKSDLHLILREASQPWLLVGWVAFLIVLALATASCDGGEHGVERPWRSLKLLTHAGAVLTIAHWGLQAFDPLPLQVQGALQAYGYYDGPIDGIIGPLTREALERFQRTYGLSVTGSITSEVLDHVGIVPN